MSAAEVAKVVMDANSVTTIINNLNSLYSTAMGQVITYTAIIIGLVGVIIPALSILFQWRSLKAEKKSLEKNIQEGIDNAKVAIRHDLIVEMKEQISIEEKALTLRMEEKFKVLDNKIECAKASVFFLQGRSHLDAGFCARATGDYCIAAESFIIGEEEVNAQAALEVIIEDCLPKINKTGYEEFEIEKKVNDLIKYLALPEVNVHGRYLNVITKLKAQDKKAKTREPEKPQ